MLNCQNPTIAIVDSGIGGVSILRQLIAKHNAGNFIYYADNLNMPYGNKKQKWIKHRMDTIIKELQTKYCVAFEEDTLDNDVLKLIAKKRGCLVKGGEIDMERATKILLTDFRAGKLGKIILE